MYQRQLDPEVSKIVKEIGNLKMLKELDPKMFADEDGYADRLAGTKSLRTLKTTQLRKFFGAIKDMEGKLKPKEGKWSNIEADFYLLKPKLANAKGRGLIPEEFYEFMKICMSKVDLGSEEDKKENFKRMVEFLEAVVAYHKYYNPKA
jgi:CRISPR-associated protein Csm2